MHLGRQNLNDHLFFGGCSAMPGRSWAKGKMHGSPLEPGAYVLGPPTGCMLIDFFKLQGYACEALGFESKKTWIST